MLLENDGTAKRLGKDLTPCSLTMQRKTLATSLFVATVLWKNTLLASEERVWMHRMSVVLVAEQADWKILLSQVTAAQSSSPTAL